MNRKELKDYFKRVKTNIKKRGFNITGVGGNPSYTYTTGLTDYKLPELIIVDMPPPIANDFLVGLGNRIIDGEKFELNKKTFGIHAENEDWPMVFIKVSDASKNEYMLTTKKFYPKFEAWQMVWCDTQGKMPWEPEYASRFLTQLLLGPVADKK